MANLRFLSLCAALPDECLLSILTLCYCLLSEYFSSLSNFHSPQMSVSQCLYIKGRKATTR